MATRPISITVGELDILVEAVPVPGSEPTSSAGSAGRRIRAAYDHAREVMVEVGTSVADTIGQLAARGAHPNRVEVEFGLKFTVQGNVVVAAASSEATLRVLVAYDATTPAGNGS